MSIDRPRISVLRSGAGLMAFALLFGLMTPVQGAGDEAAAQAAQQESIYLWTSGDFERAIKATEDLYAKFPNLQRGKAAYYHVANLLENKRAVEAATPLELKATLEEARRYFQMSLTRVPGAPPTMANQSRQGVARMEARLARLSEVLSGKADFKAASSILADLQASRASAAYLREKQAGSSPADLHEFYFHRMIRLVDAMDAMTHRLTEAHEQLLKDRPKLFDFAFEKYTPILEALVAEGIAAGGEAVEKCKDSPHFLDYYVYLGDAYGYAGLLATARRDRRLAAGDEKGAQEEFAKIMAAGLKLREANGFIVKFCEERLPSSERPTPLIVDPRFNAAILSKYLFNARGRLAQSSFAPESREKQNDDGKDAPSAP